MTTLVTVLAGYFGSQSVPESTRLWVEALRQHSQRMVLVFDNDPPREWPEHWQTDSCITLVCQRHGEYDFGSYKRGIAAARDAGWLSSASHLLLCNDSVLGPLSPLEPVLQRMQATDHEAWGLTQSDQITPHLQSYFVMLGRQVFEHPEIQAFFAGIQRQPTRHAVIEAYELGLSRLLLNVGFSLNAWLRAEDCLDPRNGERMGNPTAFPCAMVHQGVPVIKSKALRDPSANNDELHRTTKLLAQRNPELWQALWQSTPHRRLWLAAQTVTVLLRSKERDQLDAWLEWLAVFPHNSCRLMLSMPFSDPAGRAQISNLYRSWIERSQLSIHADDQAQGEKADLIMAIASMDSEWLCLGSSGLLHRPASLLVQLQRAIAQPLCDVWEGEPILVRRSCVLAAGGLQSLGLN